MRLAVPPWPGGLLPLSCSPGPREKLVELVDRVLSDAGEDVGEPRLRIDVIHLDGLCRPPDYAERFCKDAPCTRSYAPSSEHSSEFHSA
jgi:hypothetical protein